MPSAWPGKTPQTSPPKPRKSSYTWVISCLANLATGGGRAYSVSSVPRLLRHRGTGAPGSRPGSADQILANQLLQITDGIELLVSELVTNAVQAMARLADHTAVRLQLFGDQARVRIEAWDADPRPPAPNEPGEDGIPDLEGEGGRGLFLVAALSTCWDWYLTQEPRGKVVWCELEAEQPELSEVGGRPASQALLPRRIPRQVQVRPVVVMNNPGYSASDSGWTPRSERLLRRLGTRPGRC